MKRLIILVSIGLAVIAPAIARADFNQNEIIEDDAFTNTDAMSAPKIQQFLDDQHSVLAKFSENNNSAAGIISSAANANRINPEVLLATLQKEQGLIGLTSYDTAKDPSSRLKNAMGYACPDSGGCDPKYAGFTNQVNGAAFQLRYNFDGSANKKFTDYQVGQTMSFDGTPVLINNRATASLYRYTPHISGNKSFYNSYFSYFTLYASHWAGQNSYPVLAPGDSYQFRLSYQNTGNTAWTQSAVHLGTDRPLDRISKFLRENHLDNSDQTMWSSANRIAMSQSSVAPGAVADFQYYMTVPNSMPTGTYKEYFRPVVDGVQWLDDDQTFFNVTVANHQAAWAGQNFGSKTVEPGQSFMMEVKLRNSGQTTWRNDGPAPVRLGTSRSQDRIPAFIREDAVNHNPSGWTSPSRIGMLESTVAPGATGTFDFWYTVPTNLKPGLYREYFQPIQENVRWMNDLGVYFDITVSPQRAAWAGQSSNVSLSKGQSAQFTVHFRNTGTTTWTKTGTGAMQLGTARSQDRVPGFDRDDAVNHSPSGWLSPTRVSMVEDSVAPGDTGTFTFWYTVPGDKKAGLYHEYFGLVQNGYAWLPDQGVFWDITVQ